MRVKQPVLLAILDGWGIADEHDKGNAVAQANMTFVKQLQTKYPWVQAHASGEWVGLPEGQMGNSEVGHIHLGAGRIKFESLAKLNNEVKTNKIATNKEIVDAFEFVKTNHTTLHLMGMFSDGGVHSHMNHMMAVYQAAVNFGLTKIAFDLFTDGRDTQPKVAKNYLQTLLDLIKQNNNIGVIASINGRYFAMDRDKRFERSAEAYRAMVSQNDVNSFTDPIAYLESEYNLGKDDEMITPAYNRNNPLGGILPFDAVIFTNFRPDRAIQIASIMTNENYPAWNDSSFQELHFIGDQIRFVSMMKYADSVTSPHIAYPPTPLTNTLGQSLADQGYKQLRIAETEKIAHVTFFFDGGNDYFKNGLAKPSEITLKGASLDLIPSPKVATYDLKPEMSAKEITDQLLIEIEKNEFDLIVLNFANADMVGHTGDEQAAIQAVKVLDHQLERIYDSFVTKHNGIMVITADHGNAEIMIDETGQPNKKHTTQNVPIIITADVKLRSQDAGIADVAPTILDLMHIEIPSEMTQPSLILKK
ncbi:2,3-bisphosphoglycerate-independent phosphoglycerate mutase [Williamsoniiplasma luminosum]|uniref:2,3-bisphosphoglycerate-independent phosphoglycerate mutase n=1 Tax=Williamsoniiplasma luminosum TaxID=214888 RepID=A0A2S0NK59_9MOLU|nr:2,3-bisphosphoglycerate-independent phosphoglycerate mutase [Williamsoniiplasma luminosum]AVP49398.1 MAG: 2,3-bisphosphoglycerate-independent phosphoglycerate mutase [Williamsoniiplasma luminosum]